jgi:hypothetical protein
MHLGLTVSYQCTSGISRFQFFLACKSQSWGKTDDLSRWDEQEDAGVQGKKNTDLLLHGNCAVGGFENWLQQKGEIPSRKNLP